MVWTLPSGLLPWAACSAISPSSNLVKSNIERDGPPIAAGGRIFYGNIDSSVAMWVTALDYIVRWCGSDSAHWPGEKLTEGRVIFPVVGAS